MIAKYSLLLLLPLQLTAQTWQKVANEGDTAVFAASTTVRYGSGDKWTAPQIVSGYVFVNTDFFKVDPAPYIVKELDVLQTSAAQTVTVNGATVLVPGLAAAPIAGQVTASTPATVTTAAQTIKTTTPVIPAGTTLCTAPKNGGPCKNPTAIPLAPLTATVPGQTVTVTGQGFSLTCPTIPTASQPSVGGCTLTVSK